MSPHQVIPETLSRTGPGHSLIEKSSRSSCCQTVHPKHGVDNHVHTMPSVLGSGVRTGPAGDAVSLPRGVWSLGRWPWQLGLLAQKAWLCRASCTSVGARYDSC